MHPSFIISIIISVFGFANTLAITAQTPEAASLNATANATAFNLTEVFTTLGLNADTQQLILTLTSQFSDKIQDILDEKAKTTRLQKQLRRAAYQMDDDSDGTPWWVDADE